MVLTLLIQRSIKRIETKLRIRCKIEIYWETTPALNFWRSRRQNVMNRQPTAHPRMRCCLNRVFRGSWITRYKSNFDLRTKAEAKSYL